MAKYRLMKHEGSFSFITGVKRFYYVLQQKVFLVGWTRLHLIIAENDDEALKEAKKWLWRHVFSQQFEGMGVREE